jgi:hypothetical protein
VIFIHRFAALAVRQCSGVIEEAIVVMREPGSMSTSPPDFLRVEEAAAVLRIGRTVAYQLAQRFLATGGAEGLPVVRYGKQLRVPRCRLEADLGGPISWPISSVEPDLGSPPKPPTRRRARQSTLFSA